MEKLSKFLLLFSLVFTGCGLVNTFTVDGPVSVIHEPSYSSSDYDQNYFEFISALNSNSGNTEFIFLGTAVYYRIYTNLSTMTSMQSSISAVNTQSNYSAAAERMISYGYKELSTSSGSIQPLVSGSALTGKYVRIRLTNYQNSPDYKADISISSSNNYSAPIKIYTPRRATGTKYTFDFGRRNDSAYSETSTISYDLPKSGDEDFESGSVSNNMYYVDMYAVAKGRDNTFTTYYSNVLHLGSVPIDASKSDN